MSKQNKEQKPSILSIDRMISESITKIKEVRASDAEWILDEEISSKKRDTALDLSIDKLTIFQTLTAYAESYGREFHIKDTLTINGESIAHLLAIYKAVDEIFQWVAMDGLTEILLDSYRQSFLYEVDALDLTEHGLNEKIEQLFQVQITLASMVKIQKHYEAFGNIFRKK